MRDKAEKLGKPAPQFKKPLGYFPFEILPKLIKRSPLTKYVITCHMRGQSVSKEIAPATPNFSRSKKLLLASTRLRIKNFC